MAVKKGRTDGTFGASAKRAVRKERGCEGLGHHSSRHIACPDNEMKRQWVEEADAQADLPFAPERVAGALGTCEGEQRAEREQAYGDDHPGKEERNIERGAWHT